MKINMRGMGQDHRAYNRDEDNVHAEECYSHKTEEAPMNVT